MKLLLVSLIENEEDIKKMKMLLFLTQSIRLSDC